MAPVLATIASTTADGTQSGSDARNSPRAPASAASCSASVTTPVPAIASDALTSLAACTRRHGTSAARASIHATDAAEALSGEPSTPTTIDCRFIASSSVDGELVLPPFG